ncbi:HD domain-containing protein [Clostridiales bacterium COT073_COT-073]|nr:HD domain-containing protein [Clostridiales bacterium COT073_COT-073]
MIYLAEVKEGERIQEVYLCVTKQVLKTRAGKTYYSMTLQDKSGMIDAKIWDLTDAVGHFEAGDFIKIDGSVVSFQNANQLNVRRVRRSEEGEYDPANYIPTTKKNTEEMYQQFLGYVKSLKNPYVRGLAEEFFVKDIDFIKRFKKHTAAKTVHHNFQGGLLEHTLGILRTCDFLAGQYELLDRDVLMIGAMLHDIGKMQELSDFPLVDYTDEGNLVGHIVIGVQWINEKIKLIPGFPIDLANIIRHMVLSHHGELEYGSPKKPAIIEAVVLHYADNIDAKIMTFQTLLEESEQEDNWIGYSKLFDSMIRRTRYKK